MAKKYFWFKMQEDFFKSKEVKKLRKIAGGDTYTIIYQKMILLSIKTQGKIFYDGVEDNFAEEIALEIDEEADNVKLTLAFVIKNKLVDVMSDNEIVMTEAIKHIGTQDESTERVRLHRERKKQGLLPLHVTNETTEIDIELEKEKELDSLQSKILQNDNMAIWFLEEYKDYFGHEHRRIKEYIKWGYLGLMEDQDSETMEDFLRESARIHFANHEKDKCNIEYFANVLDRYR